MNRMLVAFVMAWSCVSYAADTAVYVSPTRQPTWDYGFGGPATGDGSAGNPYATIEEAYLALWKQTGNHEIRLLPGTYEYGHVGMRRYPGDLTGTMQFHGPLFETAVAWSSVTLKADAGTGTVNIVYHYPLGGDPGHPGQPAAYETTAGSGSGNIQGLFHPHPFDKMVGMKVQDVTLTVEGGGVLIGRNWDVGVDDFTFTGVDLYLKTSALYGNAAIYWHDWTGIGSSRLRFVNSNIYYEPGARNALFAGQSYHNQDMPAGFIDGTDSSRIYAWDGAGWMLKTNFTAGVWESKRNQAPADGVQGASVLLWNQNGGNPGGNVFLTNFAVVPPARPLPSGGVLSVR